MKKVTILTILLAMPLILPAHLSADARKNEWFGEWSMNHDGLVGVLRVSDSKADCASPVWCDMAVSYVDSKGTRHTGRIERIDSKWQRMVFYINFPGNQQKFEAYLFSWDKQKMAGITYWGGSTFGLYATKKASG